MSARNYKLVINISYGFDLFVYLFCQTVVRALRDQEEMLKQQVTQAKSELKEIEFNIESMNVNI